MTLFIALLVLAFLYGMTRICTVLHELSHALVALLVTKRKVTIHIGSHADKKNTLHFTTGRLEWFVKYNFFSWKGGLCQVYDPNCSPRAVILFTLAGPVLPFIIAVGAFWFSVAIDSNDVIKILLALFMLVTLETMIRSLYPSSKPIYTSDGRITYNDGQTILNQLRKENTTIDFLSDYDKGALHYNKKEYAAAAVHFEKMLSLKPGDSHGYTLLMTCYLQVKNNKAAKDAANRCLQHCRDFKDQEYITLAYVFAESKEHERSLQYYSEALKLNPKNFTAWNNKGYGLLLLGYYEKAIPCFNKAIQLKPLFAYAYNNLGYAQIKIGEWEEGYKNIKHSHRLDMNNAYVYRNFGIYFLEKKEYAEALKQLQKAAAIDANIPELQELLAKARYYAAE